jgi:hypothetical protein
MTSFLRVSIKDLFPSEEANISDMANIDRVKIEYGLQRAYGDYYMVPIFVGGKLFAISDLQAWQHSPDGVELVSSYYVSEEQFTNSEIGISEEVAVSKMLDSSHNEFTGTSIVSQPIIVDFDGYAGPSMPVWLVGERGILLSNKDEVLELTSIGIDGTITVEDRPQASISIIDYEGNAILAYTTNGNVTGQSEDNDNVFSQFAFPISIQE